MFLLAVMGIHDFEWMKNFDEHDEDLRSYKNNQNSTVEYGMQYQHKDI